MDVSGDWIKSLGDTLKVGLYEGKIGEKYRIVVPYKNKFYAIFWFQFCSDGSLYCGLRDKISQKREPGIVHYENGVYSINLDEAKNKRVLEKAKDRFSFHASGEIHDPQIGHNTQRVPISKLREQSEVFRVFFQNLANFECIHQTRKNDLCVLANIDEEYSLILVAYIAPKSKTVIQPINDGKNNYIMLLNYPAAEDLGEFCIQLCFAPNVEKGTHDISILAWPTQE